jgi:hypothetical protein
MGVIIEIFIKYLRGELELMSLISYNIAVINA